MIHKGVKCREIWQLHSQTYNDSYKLREKVKKLCFLPTQLISFSAC